MKWLACITDGWKTHGLAAAFIALTVYCWAKHYILPGAAYDGIEIALFGSALKYGQQKNSLL